MRSHGQMDINMREVTEKSQENKIDKLLEIDVQNPNIG